MHGTLEAPLRAEWRPLAALSAIETEWRALCERATERNVFYEPAFALPAQAAFGRDCGAVLVWSRAEPSRLLGFFPARVEQRYGLSLTVLVGWTHPYAPLGTPLVDRDAANAVLETWLDHVARAPELPNIALLPYLPTEGAVAKALDAVIARRGGTIVSFARHARALLAPRGDRTTYFNRALRQKKRKELRRLRRRLMDRGKLVASLANAPEAVTRALLDFLALEASGWKGRAGTAAIAHRDTREFMDAAVARLAAEDKVRIHRLALNERPIAALIALRSGAQAWCWKIAYDESFGRASPGVQIMLDASKAFLEEPGIDVVDSCATPGHPMIDHLWRERLALADCMIRPGPDRSLAFAFACALETLRRAAIAVAKAGRRLIKGR